MLVCCCHQGDIPCSAQCSGAAAVVFMCMLIVSPGAKPGLCVCVCVWACQKALHGHWLAEMNAGWRLIKNALWGIDGPPCPKADGLISHC